ncbi:MAG TPA: AEC family transporter [Victivallales bacterium]|nr:AEC family transporter [Victivallales bacterium]
MYYKLFEAVISVVLIILIGFLAAKFGWCNKKSKEVLSEFALNFTVPALLFVSFSSTQINTIFNIRFIIGIILVFYITFLLSYIISNFFLKISDTAKILYSMLTSWSNFTYIGLVLFASLFNDKGINAVSVIILITSIICLPTVIILLEISNHDKNESRSKIILKSIKRACCQPIIFASFIGIAFSCFNIHIPYAIHSSLHILGRSTAGIVLFVVGVSLSGRGFRITKTILSAVIIKLIIQPLIALLIVYILGLRGYLAIILILSFGISSGALPILFSHKYNSFVTESANILLLTNILFMVTILFFYYFLLQYLHF